MDKLTKLHSSDNGKDYNFYLMEELHNKYFPIFVSMCQKQSFPRPIQEMIDGFVIGRIGQQKGVRAFIFDRLFRLVGGDSEIYPLLAAIELHLASMYCFNVGADRKAGYDTSEKITTAFENRDIVFKLALEAIDRYVSDESVKEKIKEIFNKSNREFLKGEVLDMIVNVYDNRGKSPKEIALNIEKMSDEKAWSTFGIEKDFILEVINGLLEVPISDYCYARTYGIDAVMIENFGEIIQIILNLDERSTNKLKEYGRCFGIGMQIINDVQDYSLDLVIDKKDEVATREKNKSDVFNDLRKGNITWPIKFALSIDPKFDKLFNGKIGKSDLSYEKCEQIRDELFKKKVFQRCVLEAAYYGKLADDAIRNLGDKEIRQTLFDQSASMMKFNKYIHAFRVRYETTIQPTHSQIKRRMLEGDNIR